MFNHAPENYVCPICLGVQGIENNDTLIRQSDIVYKDEFVTSFIASYFIGKSHGHVIVVPNEHFENLYDLPNSVSKKIMEVAQKMAVAMREVYECEGITTLQNNEPIGGQHAFHYHLHLFPRYKNDELHKHMQNKITTTVEQRLPYAEKLKAFLKE